MGEARYFPPMEPGRTALRAPVTQVTLLEDRAQVRRRGQVSLARGMNRLVVLDVSAVLQDVSLQATLVGGGARVADVRARRAMRVLAEDRPEELAALERQIEEQAERIMAAGQDQARARRRQSLVEDMLQRALLELPEDASWGLGEEPRWRESFEALSARARAHAAEALGLEWSGEDLRKHFDKLVRQRLTLDRLEAGFVGWLEVDVAAEAPAEVELCLDYVVPSALWRPMHSARLTEERRLSFSTLAAVWQATGEDWVDAELSFSTARASLGTSEPMLSDDLLSAQKKAEHVQIAVRQVAVARASVGGGGPSAAPAAGIDLPGVDDGGDIQNLRAAARATVRGDGRPVFVPIARFEVEAQAERVCLPELEEKAFLRATQPNGGRGPILAGPVELVQDSGFVGWTRVGFVAPKERFELSFGPDDAVRVLRRAKAERETDKVDKWTRASHVVTLYLSNLSGAERRLKLTERIPVSEIEQVKVALLADKTSGAPEVDENGFVSWEVQLAPHERKKLKLEFQVAFAPGVQAF